MCSAWTDGSVESAAQADRHCLLPRFWPRFARTVEDPFGNTQQRVDPPLNRADGLMVTTSTDSTPGSADNDGLTW